MNKLSIKLFLLILISGIYFSNQLFAQLPTPCAARISSAGFFLIGQDLLRVGQKMTVKTNVQTTGTKRWRIARPEFASVDANGVVTALKQPDGEPALVICEVYDPCTVGAIVLDLQFVILPCITASVDPNPAEVRINEKVTLTGSSSSTTATKKWVSRDTSIAKVDSKGVVTGIKAGVTQIDYIVTEGTCSVTVPVDILVRPCSLTVSISGSSTVAVGASITLTGSSTTGTKSWSSSNTAVATVSLSGVVKGIAVGDAIIIYKVAEGANCTASATKRVTIPSASNCSKPAKPEIIEVYKGSATFKWAKTQDAISYDWEIADDNLSDFRTGNTSNLSVKTPMPIPPILNPNNKFNIRVRSRCSSGISDWSDALTINRSCSGTVEILGSDTVKVGSKITLTGPSSYRNSISWTSSDATIATVIGGVSGASPLGMCNSSCISTGTVTGLKSGTTNIRLTYTPFNENCLSIISKTIRVIDNSTNNGSKCYKIVNKATNKVLEVKDASQSEGAQIYQWTSASNRPQQTWQIKTLSSGQVNIIAKMSNKLMTASACTEGAIINQAALTGSTRQNWTLQLQTDGSYKIFSERCGMSLRVSGSSTADGASVGVRTDYGGDNFKWLIQEVPCPTPNSALSSNETFAFEAQAVEGRAQLQWVTKRMDNIDYFAIERLNEKGDFEVLDRQNSYPSNTPLPAYTFTDNNPLEGDNFYRITTHSNLLPPQYSEVKKVSFAKTTDIGLFPNPATEYIDLDLRQYEGKAVVLSFYNAVGTLVKNIKIAKASSAPQRIDIQEFNMGSYLIRLQIEGKKEITKLFNVAK